MSGPDFESLLQSPLDDESEPSGWGSAVLGFVGAVVAVVGLSLILGLWTTPDESPMAVIAAGTAPSATGSTAEAPSSFPEGFSAVIDSVAMKPVAIVAGDTGFIVSFAAATSREADPETTSIPLGGRWQLESADGSVTRTTGLVYDGLHTGVFGVEFAGLPNDGDTIRMTERWDSDERAASSDIPFPGTPFSMVGTHALDLGNGVTLRLDHLDLGRHLGQIVWTLSGPGDPMGVAVFEVSLVDSEGETVGGYVPMPSPRDPTAVGGVVDLFWDRGFDVHPDEGSVIRIAATVRLASPKGVDIAYELESVPSGQPGN